MSLQDHFHAPLSLRRHWHAFHNSWATYLSSQLNAHLPAGHFAEANVQFSANLVEVCVFSDKGEPTLAGAIELVSPANKDRPATRAAFVSRCASYVQQGVGLLTVDVVTDRQANLHDELLARLGSFGEGGGTVYAAAYRAVEDADQPQLQVWYEPLALGRALPTLPLWLRGGLCLPVELQATYERTCREQRVLVETTS